jgi:uncharacterized RDD family membrane protein YckC/DNA-directed RNA polymerase subunit RPC12/RpoP
MPVKVRCPACSKVVAAPDKARGKAIRCPDCEARIRVPAGKSRSGGAKGKRRKPSGGGDLAGLDLSRAEDTRFDVCTKCGVELEEEETECPECGYDAAVGGLGKVARLKRRRGPDPALFYSKAWSDSWSFLLENKGLALKTAMYWTIFGMLSWSSTNMVLWCDRIPPKLFWIGMATVFSLGIPGWYWFLNGKIIQATMEERPNIGRIESDFFSSIALGIKSVFWPYIVWLPITVWFIIVSVSVLIVWIDQSVGWRILDLVADLAKIDKDKLPDQPPFLLDPRYAFEPLRWVGGIAVVLSRFCFPIAQVHLNGTHSYKAFLPVDMLVVFFKNIGATLYWLVMWLAVHLPMVIAISLIAAFWLDDVIVFYFDMLKDFITWVMGLMNEKVTVVFKDGLLSPQDDAKDGIIFSMVTGACSLAVILTTCFVAAFLFAAPSVFMMRANGLFGHYNRETLQLSDNTGANVPAGFWPRWLACWADILILTSFGLAIRFILLGLLWFGAALGVIGSLDSLIQYAQMLAGLGGLLGVIVGIGYYVWAESGPAQATLGKHALGLIVTDMEGNKITRGQAFGRLGARFISVLPLGIGCIMAAFTEKKQSLHDTMTKTQVVWRGTESE